MTRNVKIRMEGSTSDKHNSLQHHIINHGSETFTPQAPVDYASRLALIGAPLG